MGLGVKATQARQATGLGDGGETACPLDSPLTGRVPGSLALVAIAAALWQGALFFGLAGGLLATISLLLSPPRCRLLGSIGLVGSLAVILVRF